jgi:tetratricopeptide (TPR) repeat protein
VPFMSRVTSLTSMPEAQLNRWIKRIGLLLIVGIVAFVAFYAVDRFRAPTAPIVDRETAALEEAVRADPTDVASRGRLADLYVAAKRYDDAIAQYTEIIKTGKQDEAAYISRGRALELKGDLNGAAADYTKVVELAAPGEMANVDPMLESANYGLGSIALQQDRADDAIGYLLKALAIQRTDADAMNLLGAAYVKAGQPEKAVEPLRRAIEFVPIGWAEPYQTLADAYTATGATELAEWAGAMAAANNGDATGAVARLEAITDGKAGLDARIGLGLLAEMNGDAATAEGWYRKALELDAQSTSAKLGLGRVTGTTEGHPSIAPSPSASGSN